MIKLLFFSGKNCSICKALKPKLFEVLEKDFPDIMIQNIDIEENLEIAAQHLVFTLPVVLLMYDKKEYYRFIKSFSVGEVLEKLDKMRGFNQE